MSADAYERVLDVADRRARRYLSELGDRPVREKAGVGELRRRLDRELPDRGEDPATVVEELAEAAEPGLIATAGPRYFGFVIGGALPAALGADMLATAWDQVASLYVCGPSASVAEEVAGRWVLEVLGLPQSAAFGLTTGGTMANFAGIAAGRHAVLERTGWDVEGRGLQGAPRVRVLVGEHAHATIFVALRMLGLGADNAIRIEADEAGRMRPDRLATELERGEGPAIVCAQAGEVNTGCFDPIGELAEACEGHGAWLHVDGAVGLWVAASSELGHLTRGLERADSWSTDAHKWLNVPYDSGLAFVAHPDAHRSAMRLTAEYLVADADAARDQMDWTPEFSRRARGFAVYAALRSLGRAGVADLVERCCARARQFADGIVRLPGCELLNDVVLNQVLFRFEDDRATAEALAGVQASGEAWMSGTTWDGRAAIRFSVSNWRTSDGDVERALAAFARSRETVPARA